MSQTLECTFNSGCLGVVALRYFESFTGKYLQHVPAKWSIEDVFLWPSQSISEVAFNKTPVEACFWLFAY